MRNYEHDMIFFHMDKTAEVTHKVKELLSKGLGDNEVKHALLIGEEALTFHKAVIAKETR